MSELHVRVGMIGGTQTVESVFSKHEISIGRSPSNDVILKRPNVSSLHCRMIFVDGVVMVGDSGSTNGTYVNGKRVTAWTPVRASDEIWVGDYAMAVSVALKAHEKERNGGSGGGRATQEKTGQKQKEKAGQRQEERKTRERKKSNSSSTTGGGQSQMKTPWEVLGVPRGTSKAEAKKAYRELLKMYHPDKVDSAGPRIKELALKITRELNEAWAKIESGQA